MGGHGKGKKKVVVEEREESEKESEESVQAKRMLRPREAKQMVEMSSEEDEPPKKKGKKSQSESSSSEEEMDKSKKQKKGKKVVEVSSEESSSSESSSESSSDEEMDEPKKKEGKKKEGKRKEGKKMVDESYEVGEFVTAMYEGQWLVAQVDINQDLAGQTHINLNYMERVGDNQFKWPKNFDLLLTLKEDLLTKCDPPGLVGSSIRANYVGLKKSDALAAEAALLVVYLQSILLELFFWVFFNRLKVTSTHRAIFSIAKI